MNEILGGICYAHSGDRSDHADWQSLQSHGYKVGEMAAAFGAEQIARYTGQLHDLGKYTPEFNARLHGGSRVDHATAGAKIAFERWGKIAIGKLMAFCIAGHHAGLANGNGEGDNCRTLKQRLALQFGQIFLLSITCGNKKSSSQKPCPHHHSKPTRIILFSPTPSSPKYSIPPWWMPITLILKCLYETGKQVDYV